VTFKTAKLKIFVFAYYFLKLHLHRFSQKIVINKTVGIKVLLSVADPDPGSSAFKTPGPGSGIRNRWISDSGSQIPNAYYLELGDKFLGKKFFNS
jgi:hypothetical protein